jgi:hypothetical protein
VEELLRHKLMPLRLEQKNLSFRETEEHLARQWGIERDSNASFWSGADQAHCAMQPAPSVQQLRDAVARHSSEITLYNYTADEIVNCTNLTSPLTAWARNLHDAGLKNLVVDCRPIRSFSTTEAGPAVLLSTSGSFFRRSSIVLLRRLREQGARAMRSGPIARCRRNSYSPKWLIDYEPINARIQAGFLSQSLRLKGLLYWRVDRWSSDPWNDVNNIGDFSLDNFPGEGCSCIPVLILEYRESRHPFD